MRICFLTYSIFHLGGVQRVVSVLSNELSKEKDIQVDILCNGEEFEVNRGLYGLKENVNVIVDKSLLQKNFSSKVYSKSIVSLNNKTKIFNHKKPRKILSKAYCPKIVQDKFVEYLNQRNYDIVIGVEGNYSLLLASISDRIKAKTIGWQHNTYDAYFNTPYKYYWNQDLLFKELIPKLDRYIVLTNDDKKLLKNRLNIDSTSIYNPLSFSSKKKSECINKKLIFVGRLVEKQKGIDLLLQAFKQVIADRSDWELYIIGDGEDKEKIYRDLDKLDLRNKVILVESTNKIQDFYLDSSIFISPSRWEGFGLVIIEAMECGLPVVAFENSGPNEIINHNNLNGILVPREDVNALVGSIITLIDDEYLRKEMGRNASIRSCDFNADKIAKVWVNVFKDLINESSPYVDIM